MANQTSLQTKSDPKRKAIISFVLGIISGFLMIIFPTFFELFRHMYPALPSFFLNIIFLMGIPAIIGLIFGVLGLKSSKRKFAIVGIILCGISLLVPLYYFLFY